MEHPLYLGGSLGGWTELGEGSRQGESERAALSWWLGAGSTPSPNRIPELPGSELSRFYRNFPGGVPNFAIRSIHQSGRLGHSLTLGLLYLPLSSVYLFICLFVCLFIFRAIPAAYGSSQDRGWNHSCSCRPMPRPRGIRVASVTYTTAPNSARSLTH